MQPLHDSRAFAPERGFERGSRHAVGREARHAPDPLVSAREHPFQQAARGVLVRDSPPGSGTGTFGTLLSDIAGQVEYIVGDFL
ncbi:MAG: hypothetical protein ACXWBL_15180, partial [Usitatibacter sp.]